MNSVFGTLRFHLLHLREDILVVDLSIGAAKWGLFSMCWIDAVCPDGASSSRFYGSRWQRQNAIVLFNLPMKHEEM